MDAGGTGALGNDQVGDRSDRREIAGQRRAHRDHEPDAMLVGEAENEGLERQDRRHIADDVGKHGGIGGEHGSIGKMEGLHRADHLRCQQDFLRGRDDDE